MTPRVQQQLAIYKGQALALCWLVQQPVGAGGDFLAGLTRTLAFSRPLTGTEWAAVPREERERAARVPPVGPPAVSFVAVTSFD